MLFAHAATFLDGEHATLEYHATKLKASRKLVARLQAFAARLIEHDKEVRKEAGQEPRSKNLVTLIQAPLHCPRPDFTKGESLKLFPLPPAMHEKSLDIYTFLNSTRWLYNSESKATSWLELFMFYRLVGGGEHSDKLHVKKPRLVHMLKQFVKQCKQVLNICGHGAAHIFTQSHHTRAFLLEDFGLRMHIPALRAELCTSPEVGERLHQMLCTIRAVKQGAGKGMLRASAGPLPRLEPWERITSKAPHPLPRIIQDKSMRRIENISIRGEKGDGRDLKPLSFKLKCPSCECFKESVGNTLFKTSAVTLSCQQCGKNTTSTKWLCTHLIPWHKCETHRDLGMRCGHGQSKGTKTIRPNPSKAEMRRLNKAAKLGPLGGSHDITSLGRTRSTQDVNMRSGIGSRNCNSNSTSFHDDKLLKKKKYKDGCLGAHPPHKRDIIESSRYWEAHSRCPPNRVSGPGIEEKCGTGKGPQTNKSRPKDEEERTLAKRARISPSSSIHVPTCRGQCPAVWTIDNYCPYCHG